MRRGDDRKRLSVNMAGVQEKTILLAKGGTRYHITDINLYVDTAAIIKIYGGNDLLYIYMLGEAGMVELYDIDLFAGVGNIKMSISPN